MSSLRPPAPRPCESCPYRRDVPSGVWAGSEYEKLVQYDAETPAQPPRMFQCHQSDASGEDARVCAGWAGCHGEELLAPRLELIKGKIDLADYQAIVEYESPVPLFGSGAEAAAHGQMDIPAPSADADRLITKISRNRTDLHPLP